ncbi:MAG: head-tail connector protein [Proteus hauseri]|nr:head-tail connector protein [Proteus hauseri]
MLSLELVKQHCNIDPDFTDDDNLLTLYIGSAVKYVENYTRRTLHKTQEMDKAQEDPEALFLTDDVIAAMLLLIAQWYENREGVISGQAFSTQPFTVTALLQPYRIYGL